MSCVAIRGCRIGEGRPKIILPIVETSEAAILSAGAKLAALPADCIEWRADWFDHSQDPEAVGRVLKGLRAALGEKLLLVTFRTKAEGGEKTLAPEEYAVFCQTVWESGCADLLDLELLPAGAALPGFIQAAHAHGVSVICSSHDFQKTPPKAEMVQRMVRMQQAGADIAKLAVMPQTPEDLLELLSATLEMKREHPETPVVTMSMGPLGAASRICGEAVGSAMTFASAGKASAPGQIELELLAPLLERLGLD